MKKSHVSAGFLRRAQALTLAASVLWAVSVTAGSDTAAAAAARVKTALPAAALRWELGDLWPQDTLSSAAVLTLSEAPLLLSARSAVAELWSAREQEGISADLPPSAGQAPADRVIVPVEETPLDPPATVDNGVPAKTLVPSDPAGYTVCGRTYISNATDRELSVQDLQEPVPSVLSGDGPQILILHTHGSEAYTPAGDTQPVWSGEHRTTDSRYNVVNAGNEMASVFAAAGIPVLHDRTLYDYPNYSGAYDRSLAAIQSYLAQYPTIQFILDVHRDAIEDTDGNEYKVVSAVGERGTAAQMTLVMGSDSSELSHPDWMENLRLAVMVQDALLREYPTLMRPVLLRSSRYNQHATTGSLLVEVGAAGNSPEEAALAARLFAEEMAELLLARSK